MAKLTINCDNQLIDAVLLGESVFKTLRQRVNLTAEISFCLEEEIQQINNETRGKNLVTDVLSFPALNVTAGEIIKKKNYPLDTDPETGGVFLGSIIICEKRAKEQAQEYGHSLTREIYYLAVHGLMHLFGYDHETEEDKAVMREMEESALELIGAKR